MPDGRRHLASRTVGDALLFSVMYTVLAGAIYFALGVVAGYALGLTPLVFLISGVMFVLAAMTYVEGSSLHIEQGGSTVFARHAFNELWSFVAGWAVLLDYVIVIAAASFSATNYLTPFWHGFGSGVTEEIAVIAIIVYVAARNVLGFSTARAGRVRLLVIADVVLQLVLIGLGLALLFDADAITSTIDLGSTPTVENAIVALGIATVVSTGLESASGLAGEVAVGRRGLRRLISASSLTVLVVYTGIAIVAISAQPVIDGTTALAHRYEDAPMLGISAAFDEHWLREVTKYAIAATATLTLVAAANSAMLGLSRLAYSLATNRQIPSAIGRLHPTRFTPWVLIVLAAAIAIALTIPHDLDMLLGLYAFGALLGLTIAHASVIRLRYKEPGKRSAYSMPFGVKLGGGVLPLPAVLGLLLAAAAWISVVITHDAARWAGLAWMSFGLVLYVVYRTFTEKPLLKRVTVPREALGRERPDAEYGSILVPIFGEALDDDIMQTAGRLAAEEDYEGDEGSGATIEAIWVFEVPMSLPIDARLPEAELTRARAALARAKAVGEEYGGVSVATATVRARRAGQAIVEEAKRRGVAAIVLAAEEPSRIRGGTRLGGRGGLENYVGDITKQVVSKATCAVILTAPPVGDRSVSAGDVSPDDGR